MKINHNEWCAGEVGNFVTKRFLQYVLNRVPTWELPCDNVKTVDHFDIIEKNLDLHTQRLFIRYRDYNNNVHKVELIPDVKDQVIHYIQNNILTADTSSIQMLKQIKDDTLILTANAKLSAIQMDGLPNAITIQSDGLYAKDFTSMINDLENRMAKAEQDIKDLQDRVTKDEQKEQQDIDNVNQRVTDLSNKEQTDINNVNDRIGKQETKEANDNAATNKRIDDLGNKEESDNQATNKRIDDLGNKEQNDINNINSRLTTDETNIANNTTAINNIKNSDEDLKKQVEQNKNDIAGLNTRVGNDEAQINQNKADIQQNKDDIQTNSGNISRNTSAITANTNRLNDDDSKITNLTNQVNSFDGRINTNANDIKGLKTEIAADEQNIANNQKEITTVSDHVNQLDGYVSTNTNNINVNKGNIDKNAQSIQAILNMLRNNYSSISPDAIQIQTLNGWTYTATPQQPCIWISYIKSHGSVTIHFAMSFNDQVGIKNNDVENNVECAGNLALNQMPKAGILTLNIDKSKLPAEINQLDTSQVLSSGAMTMPLFSGRPNPNAFPALCSFGNEPGYNGLSLKLIGVVNGYANGTKIATTEVCKTCDGFIFDGTITFAYPEN